MKIWRANESQRSCRYARSEPSRNVLPAFSPRTTPPITHIGLPAAYTVSGVVQTFEAERNSFPRCIIIWRGGVVPCCFMLSTNTDADAAAPSVVRVYVCACVLSIVVLLCTARACARSSRTSRRILRRHAVLARLRTICSSGRRPSWARPRARTRAAYSLCRSTSRRTTRSSRRRFPFRPRSTTLT